MMASLLDGGDGYDSGAFLRAESSACGLLQNAAGAGPGCIDLVSSCRVFGYSTDQNHLCLPNFGAGPEALSTSASCVQKLI